MEKPSAKQKPYQVLAGYFSLLKLTKERIQFYVEVKKQP